MGPAAELMRISKPVGILNIFFPYMYGFFFIRLVDDTGHSVRHTLLIQFPVLFFSAFILRSVGCVWNDIVDMDLDKLVERTRSRPLPRGAISSTAAYGLAFVLFACWLGTVGVLVPTTRAGTWYAMPLTGMVIAYPYMKRITNYAQVWLGFTLAWGVFFGAAIAGFDILVHMARPVHGLDGPVPALPLLDGRICGLTLLHLLYVVWSIIHDTIYAFQDYKDDKRVGIKSMALSLSGKTKPVLWVLAQVQVGLLVLTGMCATSSMSGSTSLHLLDDQQQARINPHNTSTGFFLSTLGALQERWIFWFTAVLGNALALSLMVGRVDLSDPLDCARWFKMGSVAVGSTIGIGFLFEYIWKVL